MGSRVPIPESCAALAEFRRDSNPRRPFFRATSGSESTQSKFVPRCNSELFRLSAARTYRANASEILPLSLPDPGSGVGDEWRVIGPKRQSTTKIASKPVRRRRRAAALPASFSCRKKTPVSSQPVLLNLRKSLISGMLDHARLCPCPVQCMCLAFGFFAREGTTSVVP